MVWADEISKRVGINKKGKGMLAEKDFKVSTRALERTKKGRTTVELANKRSGGEGQWSDASNVFIRP